MKIVHVSAEMAPFAKVGGLADVVAGLAKELVKHGHEVEVILPKYQFLSLPLEKKKSFFTEENGKNYENLLYQSFSNGIKLTFIEPLHPYKYFQRPKIYSYDDDLWRFLYFSKAAVDYLTTQKLDILHIHDWHTSVIPLLYKDLYPKKTGIVLTIHNACYQGVCKAFDLDRIGLVGKSYIHSLKNPKWFSSELNLLKGGVIFSDAITTVSPSYAKEIQRKGYGLEKTFRENSFKIKGILNGIDLDTWNPSTDKNIFSSFSAEDPLEKILKAKEANKHNLQEKLSLEISQKPLVSSIGRLVEQKGPKLIEEAILYTLKKEGQFILLGASSDARIQKRFDALQKRFQNNKNVHFHFSYDEKLSHEIYSASDYIVIPSLFEPCGITQLISFRYGTIPIVRKTGGLSDTVFEEKTGYTFTPFTKHALRKALGKAIQNHHRRSFLIATILRLDHSWKKTVGEYIAIYESLRKISSASPD